MNQTYFTALEIASIAQARGLACWPHSESASIRRIKRDGWQSLPETLARARAGREGGGGYEYHYSLLPEALQAAVSSQRAQVAIAGRMEMEAERDRRQVDALRVSALTASARAVMEARAEVLVSIDGLAMSQGETRAWAIARFVEAVAALGERQEIEVRRDRGEILTPREAASLSRRLALTAPDGFQLSPQVVAKANDRAKGGVEISERTIQRWFKARDERGLFALAPVPPKQQADIPAGFYDFLKFWAIPSKPSVPEAYQDYSDEVAKRAGVQLMTVTLEQVQYVIRNRLKGLDKHVGREGLLTLRSRMAYVTRTTEDMWPTTVYTADGKTFDAEVADPVSNRPMRPEITSVLDVATRKCVGYAVSRKENVIAVTEALRRSCSAHGICAIFYTDRGAGYKNKVFDGKNKVFDGDDGAALGGLMGRLGITKMHALPHNSQAKGIIERFNAVWNGVAKKFPTYIGRDMDKEAKQAVHKETRREIREIGVARRLPSWVEFIAAVEKAIADYNDEPHEGLPRFEDPVTGKRRHMTPNEAWAAHVAAGFQPVTIDPADEDDLFRPYEVRKANRCLIEWNTNKYFHEALQRYDGEDVLVGYDLHQANKVWVRELDRGTGQPGKLICVAIFNGNAQRYIPLTKEQKALEERQKAALKRLEDRAQAKRAEMDAPWLEHQPLEVADFIDVMPEPARQPVVLAVDNTTDAASIQIQPRRRVFASDADLAAWALQNPTEITPSQIDVLRECLSRSNARKVLELSGIDTEALRNLLRAAA